MFLKILFLNVILRTAFYDWTEYTDRHNLLTAISLLVRTSKRNKKKPDLKNKSTWSKMQCPFSNLKYKETNHIKSWGNEITIWLVKTRLHVLKYIDYKQLSCYAPEDNCRFRPHQSLQTVGSRIMTRLMTGQQLVKWIHYLTAISPPLVTLKTSR